MWLQRKMWKIFSCASKQLICIHNVSQNIKEIYKHIGTILAYIRAVYIIYDSIIYLYMYAGMEILPTTEGEQNTENASQFNLVNSWLH